MLLSILPKLTFNNMIYNDYVKTNFVSLKLLSWLLLIYFFIQMIFQAGEAYFISDNSPINNFEFFRPLVSYS